MKRILFWGLVVVLFSCFTMEPVFPGKQSKRQVIQRERARKEAREEKAQSRQMCADESGDLEGQEVEMAGVEESEEGKKETTIEEYLASVEPPEAREALLQAEYLYKIKNFKEAFDLYKGLAIRCSNALAFYRLGELYEKQEKLGLAFRHFSLAVENGWVNALEDVMRLGASLADLVGDKEEMSEAAQRMYT